MSRLQIFCDKTIFKVRNIDIKKGEKCVDEIETDRGNGEYNMLRERRKRKKREKKYITESKKLLVPRSLIKETFSRVG